MVKRSQDARLSNMTHEHSFPDAARFPSCSFGDGLLHAMALMAEHNVKKVVARDKHNLITGLFRLQKRRIEFVAIGS